LCCFHRWFSPDEILKTVITQLSNNNNLVARSRDNIPANVRYHLFVIVVDGLIAQWWERSGASQASRVRLLGRAMCVTHLLLNKIPQGSSPVGRVFFIVNTNTHSLASHNIAMFQKQISNRINGVEDIFKKYIQI
jgi:hypothetical protein